MSLASWATHTVPNASGNTLDDMVSMGLLSFCGVGTSGYVIRSVDGGLSWSEIAGIEANEWRGVAFGAGILVAVANSGTHRVMRSTDLGATWTPITAAEANQWQAVAYLTSLDRFVAVASTGTHRVMYSDDHGQTWTTASASSAHDWSGIASSGTYLVALAVGDLVTMHSTDGVTWADGAAFSNFQPNYSEGSHAITYSSSSAKFFIAGIDASTNLVKMAFSADDLAWSYVSAAPLSSYGDVGGAIAAPAYTGFLASLPHDAVFAATPTIIGISHDEGVTWTAEDTGFSGTWYLGAWDDLSGTAVFFDAGGLTTVLVGSFPIVTGIWYYDADDDHFEFIDDGSVPGAPWAVADPDPGDPVPDITAVQSPHRAVDGVTTLYAAPAAGCIGTTILILGSGFGDGLTVTVGGVGATVVVENQRLLTVTAPSHADGVVDVVVTNADGHSDTLAGGFTFVTPYWRKAFIYIINGVESIFYGDEVHQCSPPGSDTYILFTTPHDYSHNYGWYMSPAAFGGSVTVIANSVPKDPRAWQRFSAWATGSRSMLGGSPQAAATFHNRLYYPGNDYTTNTDNPPIRVYDGVFDRELCRVPITADSTVSKCVMSMLAANETIYLTTLDKGTSSADWEGRVFSLDVSNGILAQIGAAFTGGELPYALAWHMGRLWLGTTNGIGTVGKLYWIRPGIDTAWTNDYSLATASVGGVDSLLSFQGKLYIGSDAAAATFAKVLVRDFDGSVSTSDTGSGGAAKLNNGFLSLCEFKGNLYASYWNNDTTAVAKIRKFDGSSWSTVYTGSAGPPTTLRPFIVLFVDNGTLFAISGTAPGLGFVSVILSTPDGSVWTNLSAQLPENDHTLQPIVGVELL